MSEKPASFLESCVQWQQKRRYIVSSKSGQFDRDSDIDAGLLLLEDDGSNLDQKPPRIPIVEPTSEIVPLSVLRNVMLNMRDEEVALAHPVVHRRLRDNVTFDERKRVIALLNAVENYPTDTLPNYLGCMRLSGTICVQQNFRLACGRRVPVARLLFWLCDESEANYDEDAAVMRRTGDERGLGVLGHQFAVSNSCHTEDCINAQHYSRRNKHVHTQAELDAELARHDAISDAADLKIMHQYMANRDHEWTLTERELCRDSYVMSPVESMLTKLKLVADGDDDDSSCSSGTDTAVTKDQWKQRVVGTLKKRAHDDMAMDEAVK